MPRARREFIRNGILPVILDNPSDQQAGDGMSDAFRESAEQRRPIVVVARQVVAMIRKKANKVQIRRCSSGSRI